MEIYELVQNPKICSYLLDHEATFRYFYIKECTNDFYYQLLERGWRRFGNYFFVPTCKDCYACITIRQDCESFVFSKSHQRVLKNPLTLNITRPHLTQKHLELYNK
ncbi:MAG: arginyltransferase, partial [Helicobacter sp.]|nr:arginyltransferase [Helicobacter sp.]